MDVNNLLAGQRFDEELAKALASCDVFLAIIGPRWMDLLAAKTVSGERDYVREEIVAALNRKIVVIPVGWVVWAQCRRCRVPAGCPRTSPTLSTIRSRTSHTSASAATPQS